MQNRKNRRKMRVKRTFNIEIYKSERLNQEAEKQGRDYSRVLDDALTEYFHKLDILENKQILNQPF